MRSSWSKWLWLFLILIISIPLLFWGIKEIKKHKKENENQNIIGNDKKTDAIEYHWKIEKTIRIYFTGEYGEIRRDVQPGDNVSFENASEPYCIKNKVKEYCSQSLEDVGTQMPNSTNNGELRFKSQNGNAGYIDIIFWIWVRK